MKYLDIQETIGEVPGRLCLTIQVTGCGHKCPECHSPELQDGNNGKELLKHVLMEKIDMHPLIDCVVFLGGEQHEVMNFSKFIHEHYNNEIETCWYTGDKSFEKFMPDTGLFVDYVKYGPYIKEKGGLKSKTTNQVMLLYNDKKDEYVDITKDFWR